MEKKILIVDDDRLTLFLHERIIKQSGLAGEILHFTDGLLALQYLNDQQDADQHNMIFLDINMPVMNGWELLTALQNSPYKSRLKVAMVSAAIDAQGLKRSKQFPVVRALIPKPLKAGDLLALTSPG